MFINLHVSWFVHCRQSKLGKSVAKVPTTVHKIIKGQSRAPWK